MPAPAPKLNRCDFAVIAVFLDERQQLVELRSLTKHSKVRHHAGFRMRLALDLEVLEDGALTSDIGGLFHSLASPTNLYPPRTDSSHSLPSRPHCMHDKVFRRGWGRGWGRGNLFDDLSCIVTRPDCPSLLFPTFL